MQLKTYRNLPQTFLLVDKPHRYRDEMWPAAVACVYRNTQLKMLTKVTFSGKALRTGAVGMPIWDAIKRYSEFSKELSFRDCRTDDMV